MVSSRPRGQRTTEALPLRAIPAHLRAAAAVRSGPAVPQMERSRTRQWLISGALLAGAVLVGVAARWLIYGDALRVQDVRLSGLDAVDPLAISAAAQVAGKTLLTVDRGEVAAAVGAVPGVKSVVVRRAWPHAIAIDIVEYRGWGFWEVGERRLVVDEEGRVLEHGRAPASPALIIYEDAVSPEAAGEALPDPVTVQLVQRLVDGGSFSILRVTPTGFTFRRDRGLTVHVASGPMVVFGDAHDFEFKVATWGALLDKIESQHLAVTEIDLRFGKQVVMR